MHLSEFRARCMHSGDNVTGQGEGDDERILVDLSALPEKSTRWSSRSPRSAGRSSPRSRGRSAGSWTRRPARNSCGTSCRSPKPRTGVVMAMLRRTGPAIWEMRAIGEFHDGKTVKKLVEPAARHAARPVILEPAPGLVVDAYARSAPALEIASGDRLTVRTLDAGGCLDAMAFVSTRRTANVRTVARSLPGRPDRRSRRCAGPVPRRAPRLASTCGTPVTPSPAPTTTGSTVASGWTRPASCRGRSTGRHGRRTSSAYRCRDRAVPRRDRHRPRDAW